jgi:hypothetical protein
VPLHLTDGHGLISICQEHDIPALGTRKRRSRTGQALTWPFSSVHAITASAYRWLPGRRRDLQSLNVMPLVCPVDGALAPSAKSVRLRVGLPLWLTLDGWVGSARTIRGQTFLIAAT